MTQNTNKGQITQVTKRDGRVVAFDPKRIEIAISKAVAESGEFDQKETKRLAGIVVNIMVKANGHHVPSVEEVQDIVEQVLMAAGHYDTAKRYILYREERRQERSVRSIIGVEDDLGLSMNQLKVIERRYLLHDEEGKVTETPRQWLSRVAKTLAKVEKKPKLWEEKFLEVMANFEFLPAGRTLNNAGTRQNQLANCFVLPVEDSIEGIFDAVKWTAQVHQSGGGCIAKGAKVFTSFCGLENFEVLYDRLRGESKELRSEARSYYIDLNNRDIYTMALDPESGRYVRDKVLRIWRYELHQEVSREIEIEGHLKIITSDWHPFFVLTGNGLVEKRADELRMDDLVVTSNASTMNWKNWFFNHYQVIEGIKIDEEIGWLIGYILGDGSFGNAKTKTKKLNAYQRLRLFDGRKEALEKAGSILKRLTGEDHKMQKDSRNETYYLTTTNQKIVAWLKSLTGIEGPKDENLKITEVMIKSPVSVLAALVAGLIDSDGHVTKSRNRMEFATESEILANQVASVLNLAGVHTSLRGRKPINKKWKYMWEVRVDGSDQLERVDVWLGEYLSDQMKVSRLKESIEQNTHRFGAKSPLGFRELEPFLIKAGVEAHKSSIHRSRVRVGNKKLWLHRLKWGEGMSLNAMMELLEGLIGLKIFNKQEREQLSRWLWLHRSVRPVTGISEDAWGGDYFDFTTEHHHNYLAGRNGLATVHNTGFNFSKLRPAGDAVTKSAGGFATGPVSFMKVFDVATRQVMQGGKKRGANMGILNVNHPDIMEFITCKTEEGEIANFNISVGITDEFMRAVEKDGEFALKNPRTEEVVQKIRARILMDQIATLAWRTGDPGMIYLDEINRNNPLMTEFGRIDATNPCGEQPLHPFDACNLGSINLARFVREGAVDWARLGAVTRIAVRMLDNVIDAGKYPIPQIDQTVKQNRRIGLGVMGWAQMLFALGVAYDSKTGVELARRVMKFIQTESWKESRRLAQEKGVFPRWKESEFAKKKDRVRNVAITTIAPTGTISMAADTSSGIEPVFALAYVKNVVDEGGLTYTDPYFEKALGKIQESQPVGGQARFKIQELKREVSRHGSCQGIEEIPKEIKRVFVTAHDIDWEWHVKMQAAFQEFTDNAVSKTINLPKSAGIEEIKQVYLEAWRLKCKGITVYRDQSKAYQVLGDKNTGIKGEGKTEKYIIQSKLKTKTLKERAREGLVHNHKSKICPECGGEATLEEGCVLCHNCGWSACSA